MKPLALDHPPPGQSLDSRWGAEFETGLRRSKKNQIKNANKGGMNEFETNHFNNLRIDRLGKDTPSGSNIINKLVECGSFDFFSLQVGHRVHKIKRDATLPQLTHKQILLIRRGYI